MKKAAKGQRILSLKNKYLSLLIILLFSFGAQAQNITYTPMTAGGYQFKYAKDDSGHAVPFRNLSTGRGTTRPGSIVCNIADSLLYYWNGVIWVQLGGTGGGGGTFFGIDSITYNNHFICQWKAGTPTCYSIIPGVDSVTLHDSTLCQWIGGVSNCYIIHGNVLGSFLDSVVVIGNQLCQYKAGVPTCYTINNTSTGIDSVTVQDSLMCTWSQGVSTCFIIWTRDTIELADDLISRGVNSKGWQIIGRQHDDGVISGGIVTSAGCLSLQVTSTDYYLNKGTHYISATTILTVPTPHPTLPRTDAIILDTFGIVKIRAGTPSISPQIPSYNPASEWLLTTYPVAGGATCLNINSIVIYDENTEYTHSTSGTISADPNNTDNPEHLTKADYIATYTDSSQIIFTKSSGTDTVYNNSVFAGFIYLNNPFNNQLQMQLFNGSTSVSNNIVVNNWFDPFDTLAWQPMDIPAYAFNSAGNIVHNKIVFTLRGNDLSGASGLYIDYLRLQTGLTNPQIDNSNKVDSVTIVSGSDYYWIKGVAHLIGIRTTGTGTVTNIATGYGLSGGPITNTGTILVDSAALSLKYLRIVDTANIRIRPIAGTNVTITGTYPNLTFNSTASGATNSNIGSGFRLAIPNTNNIKTLFANVPLSLDSSSNTNGITAKADTTVSNPIALVTQNQLGKKADTASLVKYAFTNLLNNDQLKYDSVNNRWINFTAVAGATYTFSTGLTNTANTITNNVVTGIAGGQTWKGGTAANESVTIQGTNSATKTTSYVNLQPSGGLVGIGIAAPLVPLHVLGATGTTYGDAIAKFGVTSTRGLFLGYNTAGSYGYIGAANEGTSNDPLGININGGNVGIGIVPDATNKLRVSGKIKAGAGTGSPAVGNSLGVTEAGNTFFSIYNSTGATEFYALAGTNGDITANSVVLATQTNSDMWFRTNTATRAVIKNTGYIGFGIFGPTAQLQLHQGNIDASKAPLKFTYTSLATTATSGTGTVVTITFAAQAAPPFLPGDKVVIAGVTPAGYNGTWAIVSCTTTTVTISSAVTGAMTVAGTITEGGTMLTTPEAGAVEYDGTNLFATNNSATRYTLLKGLTGSATLDFTSTAAQTSAELTITVTGAADGDDVVVSPPNGSANTNSHFTARVSSANTVSVKFSNYSSGAIDPASGTFKVTVIKW